MTYDEIDDKLRELVYDTTNHLEVIVDRDQGCLARIMPFSRGNEIARGRGPTIMAAITELVAAAGREDSK